MSSLSTLFEIISTIITAISAISAILLSYTKFKSFQKNDIIATDVLKNKSRKIPLTQKKEQQIETISNNNVWYSNPSKVFLIIFSGIVFAFIVITIILFWNKIEIQKEKALLYIGLFLTMCCGMIVRVISTNIEIGRDFFDIKISELVLPILFSIIVYYPIVLMVEDLSNKVYTLIYTSFINGYFWKTMIASLTPKTIETEKSN